MRLLIKSTYKLLCDSFVEKERISRTLTPLFRIGINIQKFQTYYDQYLKNNPANIFPGTANLVMQQFRHSSISVRRFYQNYTTS